MRQYRNKRTGVVIETAGYVTGGDWVEVRPFFAKPKPAPEKEPEEEKPEPAAKPKKARAAKRA